MRADLGDGTDTAALDSIASRQAISALAGGRTGMAGIAGATIPAVPRRGERLRSAGAGPRRPGGAELPRCAPARPARVARPRVL